MENISKLTLQILQRLEALRVEHIVLMNNMGNRNQDIKKIGTIRRSILNIELGLSEAQSIMSLAAQFRDMEAENQKLKRQTDLLQRENFRLNEKLAHTKSKLRTSEKLIAKLEEKNHLMPRPFQMNNDHSNDQKQEDRNGADDKAFSRKSSRCLSQLESIGCEIPSRLRHIYELVIQNAALGRFDVVVPLCRQALVDLEETCGHNHPDVASMLNILGLICRDQKNYEEAINLLNDALSIRVKTLGEHHPAVVATLNSLAVLYCKNGKYRDAERMCKCALEIREKVFGDDHPEVAKQLNKIASLYQNLGKYDEAEKCSQRALEIYETKLGLDDPIVAKTKNDLASCYLKQHKCAEAEVLYKQVLMGARAPEFGSKDGKRKSLW